MEEEEVAVHGMMVDATRAFVVHVFAEVEQEPLDSVEEVLPLMAK